ncbi:MAG: glycosyltransferase family 4 protein [Paracoccaceae bacterium]
MTAFLAIPGDPETPTGGYIYDARLIAASNGALRPLALPGAFPYPDAANLAAAEAALSSAPGPLIIDGLAYAALPHDLIHRLPRPPLALCHHPLGHEPGLATAQAARLIANERAALALAAHVIVTSEETKRTLIAEFALAAGKVTVAPPGLDRAGPARGGTGAPLILSVGSLTPRKGHLALVAALAALAARRPDLRWRSVFAGPDDRAPATAAAVRTAIASAGLSGRITVSGAVGAAALDRLYDEAAIFALASRYEGYGMAFAEAMMRALPVVACDAPAVRALASKEVAILAPIGDDAALSTALEALLDAPERAGRMGAAGRARALAIPGWDTTWRRVASVLEAVR